MKVQYNLLIDVSAFVISLILGIVYQNYSLVRNDLFNRVPKVGSEMIWSLIDRLSAVNGFNSFSDSQEVKDQRGGENNFLFKKDSRETYVNIFRYNCTKPWSYVKHLNFLDLQEFNMTNPIYINFVRDPVDRVISWYYYKRAPWHLIKQDHDTNETRLHRNVPPIDELKRTFEECVLQRHNECVYYPGQGIYTDRYGGSHYSQIAFFCGNDMLCDKFESQEALTMAKENVEKYYAVVGVLEQLDKSLEVLENYVPRYFANARKTHNSMYIQWRHRNKNIYKPKTPKYIKEALKANFTAEYEFYEFCKQRLEKQYLAIT